MVNQIILTICAWLAFFTFVWSTMTGFVMLMTSHERAKHFGKQELLDVAKAVIWLPLSLTLYWKKGQPVTSKIDSIEKYPLHYLGTWLTTVSGMMLMGVMLVWICSDLPTSMGPRTATVFCLGHILCNMGKSVFHIKAIMSNFEGEDRLHAS